MKAANLFLLGYEDLIPVEGKAPRFKGWNTYKASLEDAIKWGDRNLGLLTERYPAIDCDVTDPDAAMRIYVAVREVFGNKTPVRVGKEPKFLALTRLKDDAVPLKKSKVGLIAPDGSVHHIELLGQGQQFVINGIHPDTELPYRWTQELVPAHELPYMSESRFNEFISLVEHHLKQIGWTVGERTDTGTRSNVNPEQLYAPSMKHLEAAVRSIPNGDSVPREVFVRMAHAVRGSTPPEHDDVGYEIFREWAMRGPSIDETEPRRVWDTLNRDTIGIGWDIVRTLAERTGKWDGLPAAVEQAQQEFDPVQEAPSESDEFPLYLSDVDNHARIAEYIVESDPHYFTSGDGDWFVWDGMRWKPDPMKAEHTKGHIAKQLHEIAEAFKLKYEGGGKKLNVILNKLHSVSYINTIFARVAMMLEVFRDRDAVNNNDVHMYTLNTPAGTWNLKDMEFKLHDADDYLTQVTKVIPDMSGKDCPEFMQFLRTSCGGDEQKVQYVLAVLGSSLTTDRRTRLIWFLTGPSGAGKSTLLKHMHAIIGDYAGVIPQGALIHGEQSAHLSAVAGFRDRRFLHGSEIDRGHKWNVALLKSITGNEVIAGRRLYHAYEEFEVVGNFIIAGNETPTLPNVDSAMRARLRVIEFDAPDAPDPLLDEKIKAEYPAILTLLMEHANLWIKDGFPYCESIETVSEEYFRSEDLIGQFRDEYFLTTGNPEHYVPSAEVYRLWEQYTTVDQRREQGIRDSRALTKALRSSDKRIHTGVKRYEGKTARSLVGINLREQVPVDLKDLL